MLLKISVKRRDKRPRGNMERFAEEEREGQYRGKEEQERLTKVDRIWKYTLR